jgi:dipeptidyl aminopeptidase/acylaminoacyl peptidase
MYPQVIYPQFIYDSAEAISWVEKNIGEYGKCEGVYVGGSSAGAYISMMLCFDDKYLKRYGVSEGFVKGYLHDAGQPTKHFRVLEERGIDPKKAIIDETAPLYYVGEKEEYPPMMFVVSDDDIKCRYEQTLLMIATLKHHGYDESKVHFKLMHGTHCAYVKTGEIGEIICEFMEKVSE